jgi:hypothetical protein
MKRTHLPLNALRVFDAAARHLSFTRAADELAVTPAAVGQQIRALEDHLGTVLFRRTSKGLELTDEGCAGLDPLREGFLRFEESVQSMQAGQASDRYAIAASLTSPPTLPKQISISPSVWSMVRAILRGWSWPRRAALLWLRPMRPMTGLTGPVPRCLKVPRRAFRPVMPDRRSVPQWQAWARRSCPICWSKRRWARTVLSRWRVQTKAAAPIGWSRPCRNGGRRK